jgi:hypothetical protein
VFQGPPNNFQQLEHLVVVDRNIVFADKTRQPAVVERKEEVAQLTPRDVNRNRVCELPSKVTHRGKVPVCYYCGKPDHLQRNCFAKQRARRKIVPAVVNSSCLKGRNKKIMGVVTGSPPRVEAQIGKLHLPVLIDSGSARSLISFSHYQQLNWGGQVVELTGTEVPCVAATGHSLAIVGEVKVTVKIHGFSWPWVFLVSKRLQGQPILGTDFIYKTRMVLDISRKVCYFHFAPQVKIPFVKRKGAMHCAQTTFLSFGSSQIKCGKLNSQQRMKLETLVQKYPDVLTARLGCTHLGEYEIQLLDKTPVRLPPYRLAPPKMQFFKGAYPAAPKGRSDRTVLLELLESDVLSPESGRHIPCSSGFPCVEQTHCY